MPERIQLSRKKGWKMPPNTVKVTRPGIWSNPFIANDAYTAVEAYRRLITGGTQRFEMNGPEGLMFSPAHHPNTLHWAYPDWVRKNIGALRGRNLACWCNSAAPCHADVLLELANRPVCDDPAALSQKE